MAIKYTNPYGDSSFETFNKENVVKDALDCPKNSFLNCQLF